MAHDSRVDGVRQSFRRAKPVSICSYITCVYISVKVNPVETAIKNALSLLCVCALPPQQQRRRQLLDAAVINNVANSA